MANEDGALLAEGRKQVYVMYFKTMDDMGVDMQLICPGPPQLYYTVPVEVGVKATRMLNDGIAEYVGKRHAQAAVTDEADDGPARPGQGRSDGGRQGVTHGGQAVRDEQRPRFAGRPERHDGHEVVAGVDG